MSSTYSNLKFELIGTGDQSGTWGSTTNTNIGTAIEQAIVGMATLTSADFTTNVATLTLTNTNAVQNARALCLVISAASLSAAGTLNVPAIQKPYLIINNDSFAITVKVTGQTGVSVPAGKRTVVYNNGTDVGNQIDYLSTLALGTALPVTSGGTGTTTPNLVAGTNITLSGTWPNQTINAIGSGSRIDNGVMNNYYLANQAAFGSYATASSQYVLDRWIGYATNVTSGTDATYIVNSSNQMVITAGTLAGTSPTMGLSQRIESVNCVDLQSQSITISFDALASAAVTASVYLAYANTANTFPTVSTTSGVNAVTGSGMTAILSPVSVSVTTSLTRYSATFDLTSAGANVLKGLAIGIQVPITSTGQTLTITKIQVEKGTSATPFQYLLYQQDMYNCSRYYEVITVLLVSTLTNNYWAAKSPKRTTPTLTVSAPTGSGAVFSWGIYTFPAAGYIYQSTAHSLGGVNANLLINANL